MNSYTAKQLASPTNATLRNEVAKVLANAFAQDASHKWLLGNLSRGAYAEKLPRYMHFILSLTMLCDATVGVEVETGSESLHKSAESTGVSKQPPITGDVKAVSITIPPHGNAAFDSLVVSLRAGAATMPLVCGVKCAWRLVTTWIPLLESMHARMFPDKATKYHNWHLLYLGVHSDYQGQGLGGKMVIDIQEMVRQYNVGQRKEADAKGVAFEDAPLYLEASSLSNRRLYSRKGFRDICTGTYGEIDEGEDLRVGSNADVVGGRLFGMIWQAS